MSLSSARPKDLIKAKLLDGRPTVVVIVVVVVVVLTVDSRYDGVGGEDGGTHEVQHVERVGLVKLTGSSSLHLEFTLETSLL